MNVGQLKAELDKYPDDMEVMTKKNEILGNVGHIWSTRQDSYAFFGADIPCVLLVDEDPPEDEEAVDHE